MAVKLGILALLEAKPGKGDDLADFLRSGRELSLREEELGRAGPKLLASDPDIRTVEILAVK
jgi:hypothetical protein